MDVKLNLFRLRGQQALKQGLQRFSEFRERRNGTRVFIMEVFSHAPLLTQVTRPN